MGRKKIEITEITNARIRYSTFLKRKIGLIKKAAELSKLCRVKMLLMFEDLNGDLIRYSTHGIFEPSRYFEGAHLSYEFTIADYPGFFAKEVESEPNSDQISINGADPKNDISMEEEKVQEIEEKHEPDAKRKGKCEKKMTKQPGENKTRKSNKKDSLKFDTQSDNHNPKNDADNQPSQKESSFAKHLQELLLIESRNPRIRKQKRKVSKLQHADDLISNKQNNAILPFDVNPLDLNDQLPQSTGPSMNSAMGIETTASSKHPNLMINDVQELQLPSEPRRVTFALEECIEYSQSNSRPPSPLNAAYNPGFENQIYSRRSSITSLLDLFRIEEEMADEDQIEEKPRARSYGHSRVPSNNSIFSNRSKKFDDGFFSRRHSNHSSSNQLFAGFNQTALHDSLTFEKRESRRRMSVEMTNSSRSGSKSRLTSASGHKSGSLDRFLWKKANSNYISVAHSRANSKDSNDRPSLHQRIIRRKSRYSSGGSLHSPSNSEAFRDDQSPRDDTNFDSDTHSNSSKKVSFTTASKKFTDIAALNFEWGLWTEKIERIKKKKKQSNGSESSSIFKSPRLEKKVKFFIEK